MAKGVRAQRRRLARLWDNIESRYGLLTEDEARALSPTGNLKETGLLSVVRNGEVRYPGFQFTSGSVRSEWREVTTPLLQAGWQPEEILLWFAAPTGWLDARTPIELFDEDLDAVRAAVASAALGPGY